MNSNRVVSVDILKFLAVLLVIWSHLDEPLGKYSYLATGGAFGDSLFFFCSGFTLFLGKPVNGFFNWYKRRICRIYPTVFAYAFCRSVLAPVIEYSDNLLNTIMTGGGFFVSCIMVFYIFFYFIRKYASNHLISVLLISVLVTSSSFFVCDIENPDIEYRCLWSLYFCVMLLGGIVGKRAIETSTQSSHSGMLIWVGLLLLSVASYYGIVFLEGRYNIPELRVLTVHPLMSFSICAYYMCCSRTVTRIFECKYVHPVVMFCGSICLEAYIVQPLLITGEYNNIFPWNLLLIFISILLCAYLLKCLSKLWKQTFSTDGEYDWRDIVRPY